MRTATDYFPFGEKIDARTYVRGEAQSASDKAVHNEYRYGFNGKEDDLTWGESSLIQDYGFRLYSPAMGRFLSPDPLAPAYAFNSTYSFAQNDVIRSIDLDGLERAIVINDYSDGRQTSTQIHAITDYDLGGLVNLNAHGTVTGTHYQVPALTMEDILVINRGDLPSDINPTEVRQTFTGDENTIIKAGADQSLTLGRTSATSSNTLSPLAGVSIGPTDVNAPLNQEHRVSRGAYVEVATYETREVQVSRSQSVPIPPLQIAEGGLGVNTVDNTIIRSPVDPSGFEQMKSFFANAAQNGAPVVDIELRLTGTGASQLNAAATAANLQARFNYPGQINVMTLPVSGGQGGTTISSPGSSQQVTQTVTETQRVKTGTENQLKP